MPDGLLNGRRALVTGAARGIGFATARRFCDHGASVALCDVGELDGPVDELAGQGHTALAVPFDVASEDAVEAGVAEARQRLGGLDVLVANAGIVRFVPALDTSLELWRQILDVNLTGVFLCLRAAGRVFREQGHGVLLATSSQAGLHGYRGEAAYCASKFGVVGFSRALAAETKGRLGVTTVFPAGMDTRFFDGRDERYRPGPDAELIDAADAAEAIMFALTRPAGVELRELVICPEQEPSWP